MRLQPDTLQNLKNKKLLDRFRSHAKLAAIDMEEIAASSIISPRAKNLALAINTQLVALNLALKNGKDDGQSE